VRSANASEARWQIASAAPVDRATPNRSRAISVIARRETRYAAVNATNAACNRHPNGEDATSSGNVALVRARQQRHRNWWVRCSVHRTLIGGNSAT
jgi:hypothetical protein